MSLRLKLVVLFAGILFVTSGVTAVFGQQLARRQVEDEIRARAEEDGKAFIAEMGKSSSFERHDTESLLKKFLRDHNGLNAVELGVELPGQHLILRVTPGPNGPQLDRLEGDAASPRQQEEHIGDGPDGRYWAGPLKTTVGRSSARLTLEASLAEADTLAASERRTFWIATLLGAVLIIVAAQVLISRVIGRPITRMADAMAQVESGRLDIALPLGADKEFDHLARGFNTMLGQIRGFNQELTERIEQATADLNKKNRDLLELNDLLVAARRDLTAKERLAALGQLAGTIAHELGNPLNSISGHVQLLERSPSLPPALRDDLQTIGAEVRRMTDVIRRFLDSTRGLRPAPEPVDLRGLVTEALDMSLSADARSRLQVQRDLGADLDGIVTDPSLVRHVLTNLIANAVDAMPRGGALHVAAKVTDGELRLSVQDSGTGISAEDRRRIFEPFFTTKARGKGTGLGLAICREIAVALKGRIDVETELGKGATFTLALPLQRASEPRAPAALTAEVLT